VLPGKTAGGAVMCRKDKLQGRSHMRLLIVDDDIPTTLKNYPLYCPKCKQETLIEVINLKMTVIGEPDAKTQSR